MLFTVVLAVIAGGVGWYVPESMTDDGEGVGWCLGASAVVFIFCGTLAGWGAPSGPFDRYLIWAVAVVSVAAAALGWYVGSRYAIAKPQRDSTSTAIIAGRAKVVRGANRNGRAGLGWSVGMFAVVFLVCGTLAGWGTR